VRVAGEREKRRPLGVLEVVRTGTCLMRRSLGSRRRGAVIFR